jgi:3-hydroxymyristoyl/3-hydroxydecanoyl-(acyl carrier protein) dehydratase
MGFFYVDRILEYETGKFIRGIKNVTRNEPFFYWLPDGRRVLSPTVISEAAAQVAAFLKMIGADFQKRPVLLADELTVYSGVAEPGDQIELFVEIVDHDEEVIITRSRASVRGKPIQVSTCGRGYLLPMEEFDDPANLRRMFNRLYRPDLKDARPAFDLAAAEPLKPFAGFSAFDTLRLLDGVVKHEPGKQVVAFKNCASSESWFRDHFPRKPVVPGVLMLSMVGETCQYLVKDDLDAPVRGRALIPTWVRNVRLRKFVEPGDQFVVKAEVRSGDTRKHNSDVVVHAVATANGNRVLQAEMGFRTMFATDIARGVEWIAPPPPAEVTL